MRSKVEYEREQIRQRVQQQQAAVESKLAEARGPKGKLAKEAAEAALEAAVAERAQREAEQEAADEEALEIEGGEAEG